MTERKYLSPMYDLLTPEEKHSYMQRLANALIKHKCLYYVFNINTISDFEYDIVERVYEAVCKDLETPPVVSDMVGFNMDVQECLDVYNQLLKEGHVPNEHHS